MPRRQHLQGRKRLCGAPKQMRFSSVQSSELICATFRLSDNRHPSRSSDRETKKAVERNARLRPAVSIYISPQSSSDIEVRGVS